jgi:hypothetical protein
MREFCPTCSLQRWQQYARCALQVSDLLDKFVEEGLLKAQELEGLQARLTLDQADTSVRARALAPLSE